MKFHCISCARPVEIKPGMLVDCFCHNVFYYFVHARDFHATKTSIVLTYGLQGWTYWEDVKEGVLFFVLARGSADVVSISIHIDILSNYAKVILI